VAGEDLPGVPGMQVGGSHILRVTVLLGHTVSAQCISGHTSACR
jgi:hypothetical protein